jgi:hypothetical protein
MLSTRPSKRVNVSAFNRDIMMDVVEGERPVGSLVLAMGTMVGTIRIGDRTYTAQRASDHDERLYEALIRVMQGGEKPKNPWTLSDEAGQALAAAEQVQESFAVSRGDQSFILRRKGRPYHLYRAGSEQSLGWVGQQKFFTRQMHMDLPAEFDPPFQVFLLVLLLGLTMKNLENLTS